MGTAGLIFVGLLAWIAILDLFERPVYKMKWVYMAISAFVLVVVLKG